MPEPEIGFVDGGKLKFNQSFLQFNVKKKIQAESSSQFDFKYWILDNNNAKFTREGGGGEGRGGGISDLQSVALR